MTNQLDDIIDKIKALEGQLIEELQKQQAEFSYEIEKRRIRFEENIIKRHKEMAKDLVKYIADSSLLNILSTPIIWSCLFPAYQ